MWLPALKCSSTCRTLIGGCRLPATRQTGRLGLFSTINRNPKSYLFAIIGAEYLLKFVAQGTHDYAKLIKPSELATWSRQAHLTLRDQIGMGYNPLTKNIFCKTAGCELSGLLRKTRGLVMELDTSIECVLFDLDGTLIDTARILLRP